jgi:hypothetical protein
MAGEAEPELRTIAHPKKAAFLAAYAQSGDVSDASRAAGISRRIHYLWLRGDAEYSDAFDEAKDEAVEALVREALRRAVQGFDEPVFHQGVQCGTVRKYSDTLLIFLMKGADPKRFVRFDRPAAPTLIQQHIEEVGTNITLVIPPPRVIGRVQRDP